MLDLAFDRIRRAASAAQTIVVRDQSFDRLATALHHIERELCRIREVLDLD